MSVPEFARDCPETSGSLLPYPPPAALPRSLDFVTSGQETTGSGSSCTSCSLICPRDTSSFLARYVWLRISLVPRFGGPSLPHLCSHQVGKTPSPWRKPDLRLFRLAHQCDNATSTAILDRLVHHFCDKSKLNGRSFLIKETSHFLAHNKRATNSASSCSTRLRKLRDHNPESFN